MNSPLKLMDLECFIRLTHSRNFAKTAAVMGLSPAGITRALQSLESELGIRLFQRTTRTIQITEEGKRFIPLAEQMLQLNREAKDLFSKQKQSLHGRLKVTCPVFYGRARLLEPMIEFRKLNPDIKFDLILTERVVDLIEEGVDLAIRIFNLNEENESNVIARKVESNPLVVCASPGFVKENKLQRRIRIQDLEKLPCLYIDFHEDLHFEKETRTLGLIAGNRPFRANESGILVALALRGEGLLIRSKWDVIRELKSGKLVELTLADPLVSETDVFVVYPKTPYLPHRVRAFIDTLIQEFNKKKAAI